MAEETQRSDIRKIASSAALSDRHDVVGIPQCAPIDRLQSPRLKHSDATWSAAAPQRVVRSNGIGAAQGTDSLVSREGLLTQKAGIRA